MGLLLNSNANDSAKEQLAKLIATERPIALVGAGLSVPSGLPTWNQLLDEMDKELPSKDQNKFRTALRKQADLLWRAQEYKELFKQAAAPREEQHNAFLSFLQKRFAQPPVISSKNPAVALVKLPFRHFMTTNYDDVLIRAHRVAKLPAPHFLNWSNEDDIRTFIFSLRGDNAARFLLHLHGHYTDPNSIVLTDNDYTERYVRTNSTTRRLFAIFTTERVVFVGFSLNDPDLMALLREVNAVLRSNEPRHFAIMGLDKPISEGIERSRLRNRYGVEPVFYHNHDGKHEGLSEILSFLRKSIRRFKNQPDSILKRAEQRADSLQPRVFDPEDPQKGRWGGQQMVNGREVNARVRELDAAWFEVTITVRSTSGNKPLAGTVFFHLHPTFIPPVRSTKAKGGVAVLTVESYGAFTLGVEADDGKTHLELDLATLEDAPKLFRMN